MCAVNKYAFATATFIIIIGNPILWKYKKIIYIMATPNHIAETYLRNSINENLYPNFSATPAQITFAEAPINVPFPPKHAPNDNDQINGCNGNANS